MIEQSLISKCHQTFTQDTSVSIKNVPISFAKGNSYSFSQLVKNTCPQIMHPQFLNTYKKQLNVTIFQFIVKIKQNSWVIRRRIEDLVQLQKQIRSINYYFPHLPVKKQTPQVQNVHLHQLFLIFLNQISLNIQVREKQIWQFFIQISEVKQRWRQEKFKEAFIKKQAGGRYQQRSCNCGILCGNWRRRYFVITKQGVYYCSGNTQAKSNIKQMLAFNFHFRVKHGLQETGNKFGIRLCSSHRQLALIADNVFMFVDIIASVKNAMDSSQYLKINRFGSFSPPRQDNQAKFFIDGQGYFKQLFNQLMKAKKSVYITDWWLSPQFCLLRPASYNDPSYFGRFDQVMQRIAKNGVKVSIIVYLQPKMALNNDSQYTKQKLQSLHPNIKVLRHPQFLLVPFLWSHHQKMVVIDQKVGFMGGLDICYGRMDNPEHILYDHNVNTYWPGLDYCNMRIKDFQIVRNIFDQLIDRNTTPRMPWHDIAIKIVGNSVIDLSRHFVQYWNFVNFQTINKKQHDIMGIDHDEETQQMQRQQQINPIAEYLSQMRGKQKEQQQSKQKEGLGMIMQQEQQQMQKVDMDMDKKISVSDDYRVKQQSSNKDFRRHTLSNSKNKSKNTKDDHSNQFIKMISDIKNNPSQKDQEFYMPITQPKKQQPRRPQRDRNDNRQSFIQAFNHTIRNIMNDQDQIDQNAQNQLFVEGLKQKKKGTCNCQLLRSSSDWSIGMQKNSEEMSIYLAYLQLIDKAKEFIYIQNQFFISSTAGKIVKNKIVQALVMRIKRAAKENKKFRVVVVIPLLPGFEGQIDSQSSGVFKIQLHWQYFTISRGGNSILEQLSKVEQIQNVDDYISFYGLRSHGVIKGKPVTEILYVHSKLLIIDDQIALIGSANLNDRSMLGKRDSQLAIVVQDTQKVIIQQGKNLVYKSKFAHGLRKNAWMEHFGLSEQQSRDAVSDKLHKSIKIRTQRNAQIFKRVFGCYPDCNAKTYEQMYEIRKQAKLQVYDELSGQIRGHAVPFPLQFMMKQDLKLKVSQKQYYVPDHNFT